MSTKPDYPKIIISHPEYRLRMDINNLLSEYPKLLVVRCVDGNKDDYYMQTENGKMILSEKVFKNSMANLSMNLAGGLFDTDSNAHLRFLPATKEAAETWNGDIVSSELYSSEDSYYFYEKCFGLCFYVSEIHERTFPFYKHFESQYDRDIYEAETMAAVTDKEMSYDAHFVAEFKSKKESVEVRPRLKVNHAPTNVNYWHITLDTFRPTDKDFVKPTDKLNSSDKSMFKALKQDLVQCCYINISPEYQIDSTHYVECKHS